MKTKRRHWKWLLRLICAVAVTVSLGMSCLAAGTLKNPFGSKFQISDVKKGTVRILNLDVLATGSGFGIGTVGEETEYFITNRHLVYDDSTNTIASTVYILLNDNAVIIGGPKGLYLDQTLMVPCDVIYPGNADPEYPDFAILRATQKVEGRMALPLMNADSVPDGTDVWAVGYPGTADDWLSTDYTRQEQKLIANVDESQLTKGTIQSRMRNKLFGDTYMLYTSAHINHGNSGGPLVTEKGQVIGINTYGFNGDEQGSEYNGAIYIDYAMKKLDELGIPYNDFGRGNETLRTIITVISVLIILGVLGAGAVIFLRSRQKKPDGGKKDDDPKPAAVAYRLQGIVGQYGGRRFPIDRTIQLGRGTEGNDLSFYDTNTRISRAHCRIVLTQNGLFLEDLRSSNGTFLNGTKLLPNQPARLNPGDLISLADEQEQFRIDIKQ